MFNRIALRFAAVEALCPHDVVETGPWPTLAGPRVFDSRQDPIDLLDPDEQRPLIIVYTEEHEGSAFGRAARHGSDEQIVSLVLELMIATRGEVPVVDADGLERLVGSVDVPVSDWRHEMLLDALEGMVMRALYPPVSTPSVRAFRKVAIELRQFGSVPLRSADKTVRLAARTLTLKLQVAPDAWPTDPSVAGIDRLPAPLSGIGALFPPDSVTGRALADLAALAAAPDAATPLAGVDLFARVNRPPPANPTEAEIAGLMLGDPA